VGLTGGIASGKNFVADLLETRGIPVVDADPIGHELIRPGAPCYRPLLRLFGRGVLARNGRIVRGRVARIVFGNARKRRALNALMHPPIMREADRRARQLYRRGKHPVIAVSAALLVESGAAKRFDRVVLVACRPEVQLRRLRRRDGLDLRSARARLTAQISDAQRRRVAHHVIDNSGSRLRTRRQVSRLAEELRRAAGAR
jgi:dephospho-CoA kinase